MADKFHINNKGKIGKCTALNGCKFGDISKHYDSVEEAEFAIQEELKNMYGVIPNGYEDINEDLPLIIPQEEVDFAVDPPKRKKIESEKEVYQKKIEDLRIMKAKLMLIKDEAEVLSIKNMNIINEEDE